MVSSEKSALFHILPLLKRCSFYYWLLKRFSLCLWFFEYDVLRWCICEVIFGVCICSVWCFLHLNLLFGVSLILEKFCPLFLQIFLMHCSFSFWYSVLLILHDLVWSQPLGCFALHYSLCFLLCLSLFNFCCPIFKFTDFFPLYCVKSITEPVKSIHHYLLCF